MKERNDFLLLVVLMSMMGMSVAAHDIEVANSDGVTIYYSWANNNTELSVSSPSSPIIDAYSCMVVIPESVTYEGETYSVTSIGHAAFLNCFNLTSITIPNSVTAIYDMAFYNCI